MNRINLIIFALVWFWSHQTVSAQKNEKIPEIISGGLICGKAVSLPKPSYPAAAKAANVSGKVEVSVIVGKDGKVESARAVSGHPLLVASAEKAALAARFSPLTSKGNPVKVKGIMVYNFVLDKPQDLAVSEPKPENSKAKSRSKSKIIPSRRKTHKKTG